MIRNFCKTQDEPRGWEKNGFWRGKTHRISPKNFLRPRDTYKKYILQKNWVKTVIPAFSSGQSNLPPSIWGPSRQLDDQHRNTNMNDKDHLVGQLIRPGWSQTSSSSCDSTVALAETEVSWMIGTGKQWPDLQPGNSEGKAGFLQPMWKIVHTQREDEWIWCVSHKERPSSWQAQRSSMEL